MPPVGWFPLAPHEVYVPAYRASPRYVRQVNITNVTNVTNINTVINNRNVERDFANRRLPHAVTFVPAEVIARHQPVAPAAARFRDDPHVREIVANAAPAHVTTAPPVTAPPPATRAAQGKAPPRPPFEANARGGFVARPDAARSEAPRTEAGRPPEPRSEAPHNGARPSTTTAPATPTPTPAGPPVRGRGPLVEPSTAPVPATVAPPRPVQPNAQPGGGPKASVVPGQHSNAMRDAAPPREAAQPPHTTERCQPPRPRRSAADDEPAVRRSRRMLAEAHPPAQAPAAHPPAVHPPGAHPPGNAAAGTPPPAVKPRRNRPRRSTRLRPSLLRRKRSRA